MSGTEDSNKEQRFWRALVPDTPVSARPIDLTHDLSDLNAEQREERRQILKSMLAANEARQQGILRNRRPTMEIGQRLAIISGQLSGKTGVVLDADFIHNRVQLDVEGMLEPQWLSFRRVGCI